MAESKERITATETEKSEDGIVAAQDQPQQQQQQAEEVEMWTYYDPETGERQTFPKPEFPSMEDFVDNYIKLIPELEEIPDEEEYVRPPELQKKLNENDNLTRKEIVEIAMHEDRFNMEQMKKKKAKRVKRKISLVRRFLKEHKFLRWDFPKVEENYTEEMLGEEWVERPLDWKYEIGHDPMGFSGVEPPPEEKKKLREQWIKNIRKEKKQFDKMVKDPKKLKEFIKDKLKEKETPLDEKGHPLRNYYVPYYRSYPVIPQDNPGVRNEYEVLNEMARYDRFIHWRSYMFSDGSSYEGTVWDDTAYGKGVLKAENRLYEGEFLLNQVEGYGVFEMFIPLYEEPIPDSKEEKKLRAEGKFLFADYLEPGTREWLKKDMEDLAARRERLKKLGLWEDAVHISDDPIWVELYGELPDKGRYKYSGTWKHSRMHGCGIMEVNDTITHGKWYFGELMMDPEECSIQECISVAATAKVAAAKAKMFTLKPDGMVKAYYYPHVNDPIHPYIYINDSEWMAPGWVNAFYEVPDEFKEYVKVVDEEQAEWLDKFTKVPLVNPDPSEREYMWENADKLMVRMEDGTVHNIDTGITYQVVKDPCGRTTYIEVPADPNVKYIPFTREEFYHDPPPEKSGFQKWLSNLQEYCLKVRAETEEELKNYYRKLHKELQEDREEHEMKKKIIKEEYEFKKREIRESLAAIREIIEKRKKKPEEEAGQRQDVEKAGQGQDVEKAEEVKADEEEEEEDDTKPRSFGKVEHDEEDSSNEKPQVFETGDDADSQEDDDDKKPQGFGKVTKSDAGEVPSSTSTSAPFAAISLLRMALPQIKKRAVRRHQEWTLPKSELLVTSEPVPAFVNLRRVGRKQQRLTLRIKNSGKQCVIAPGLSTVMMSPQSMVMKSSTEPVYLETWETPEKKVLSMAIPV